MRRHSLLACSTSFGLVLALVACGSDTKTGAADASGSASTASGPGADTEFCTILAEVSALLEPRPEGTDRTPEQTKAGFDNVAALLTQAEIAAPPTLTADIAKFATAIDTYREVLATVGYDLDALYSTPGGVALAESTSHALSPAVIEHMTSPCGISPNHGEQRTP